MEVFRVVFHGEAVKQTDRERRYELVRPLSSIRERPVIMLGSIGGGVDAVCVSCGSSGTSHG